MRGAAAAGGLTGVRRMGRRSIDASCTQSTHLVVNAAARLVVVAAIRASGIVGRRGVLGELVDDVGVWDGGGKRGPDMSVPVHGAPHA